MVLQDTWLFEGSVRENLLYNNENVSEETMINACKACGIHSFIKALPQGYDTILTDNTFDFSRTETAAHDRKGNDPEQPDADP